MSPPAETVSLWLRPLLVLVLHHNLSVGVSAVPPPVTALRGAAATENSLSLEWSAPVLQNQHAVLDYQVRYSRRDGQEAGQWQYVSSRSASVVLTGLQRAAPYQVQVRARSQAGYGSFSATTTFSTLPDGTDQNHRPNGSCCTCSELSVCVVGGANPQLVLTAVLISVGILLAVATTTAALLCYR